MKWQGPLIGGITQSLLSKFLECPYQFYIYAGLGLEEPKEPEPNLVWGDTFHRGLEHIIEIPYQLHEFTPEDWATTQEVVEHHLRDKWPMAPQTYCLSINHMLPLYDDSYKTEYGTFRTEQKLSHLHTTRTGNKVLLRGKADAVNVSNEILVEHKCKGKIDINQTYAESPYDLQVTMYSFILGTRTVIYDLVRIPDTQWSLPPKRQYESPKNYIKNLYFERAWGDFPVTKKKHLWLQQTTINLTDEQVELNMAEMVDPIIDKLCAYYDYVSDSNFDFQNPDHYNKLFYKTPIRHFDPARTASFKGPYWNHRVGALDLDCMVPVHSFYAELEDEC